MKDLRERLYSAWYDGLNQEEAWAIKDPNPYCNEFETFINELTNIELIELLERIA